MLEHEQINIYDCLGFESDPLFNSLDSVKKGDSLEIAGYVFTRNSFGLYELSSDNEHMVFSSLSNLYEHLNRLIKCSLLVGH